MDIPNIFGYHPATEITGPKHDVIRMAFQSMAEAVVSLTEPGPNQTVAIRKLQEAMWAANAAIAIGPNF